MSKLATLRCHFQEQKAALLESLASSGTSSTRGVRATLAALSALADATLRSLWQEAGFASDFALLAVGGFGRGELFPYSDVDVLLLVPDKQSPESDAALKARIEGFIGSCWDVGLEIGSSVRTLGECQHEAAHDVTIQTSLLEARRLIGNTELFVEFQKHFFSALDPHAFFVAKTLELQQRHSKYEDTPYALEPNCKESPGGLRDLQVILWVAKAAGFGGNWDALARNGLATAFEVKQIKHNEALLRLVRARLHLIARRREDRLVFDLQTPVAQAFGYGDAPTLRTDVSEKRAFIRPSEALMRRYYWAAKA
ncbi:MAG: nucleotidyltransferase domain-containing protein, partial [Comamonadaceae bacterium]